MKRSRPLLLLLLLALAAAPAARAQTFTTFVPADDGAPLATDVYLVPLASARPVVLMRTPYGRDGMGGLCVAFNLVGYHCVVQDFRGFGGSGGGDGTIFRHDGDDGRATLAWALDQSWCDGRVAAVGASALAIAEYLMAPDAVPDLRCMFAAAASADMFHFGFFQGGAVREADAFNWLDGLGLGEFYDEIRQHRTFDAWWQEPDVLSRARDVRVPILHIGGWYDIFQQGTLETWAAFQRDGGHGAAGRQYLIVGPWTHDGFLGITAGELVYPNNAAVDPLPLLSDWLGYWVRNDPTGVEDWPPVMVYLMGPVGEAGPGNEWLALDHWPPPSVAMALFPAPDGTLRREPAPAGQVELLSNPGEPVPTLGGANLFADLTVAGRAMGAGPYDQRPVEARDDVAVFTTDPLDEPLTVMGRVRCRLWVLPDTLDLDLSVRLTDVYPDGRSMLVTDGIQRARFRCGDDRECLLTPGVPTLIEVDLSSTAIVFAAGHRVRLDIAGSNWPRFEVNANDGGDLNHGTPTIARPRILTGPDHPSALLLPVEHGPVQAAVTYNE